MILIGFFFVSRRRHASNAAPSVSSLPPQHLPLTHPHRPRRERDYWKIWKIWCHTSTNLPAAAGSPAVQVFPVPVTITSPSPIIYARDDSKTDPPIVSRPSQSRRVTSLSVTTSFSHSHITQEELNNFRLSAYDLDGDLETEMLNSATDDVWSGQALAVEDGCRGVGVGETIEAGANAIEGSAEGDVPPSPTSQWRGGDYENLGVCQSVAPGSNGVKGDVLEVDKVAMGTQTLP